MANYLPSIHPFKQIPHKLPNPVTMLQKHADKLLQFTNVSDIPHKLSNDGRSNRSTSQPLKKHLKSRKPNKETHKIGTDKLSLQFPQNEDFEEKSMPMILPKEPSLLQKLKRGSQKKAADRQLIAKGRDVRLNSHNFEVSRSGSPSDSSEGKDKASTLSNEIEQNSVNKIAKTSEIKILENSITKPEDPSAMKPAAKMSTPKKKRRRRSLYTLKRRINTYRKKPVQVEESEDNESSFEELAVLDISQTDGDFWNQGLGNIVELKSPESDERVRSLSTYRRSKLLQISQQTVSKRGIRRTTTSKSRKLKDSSQRADSVEVELASKQYDSVEDCLEIKSRVTDISNDGVVKGILWLSFQSDAPLSGSLNAYHSKGKAENGRWKSHGSEDSSYEQRKFRANELELRLLSKRIKKEQEDAPTGNIWGKLGKQVIPSVNWNVNVKMEECDRNVNEQLPDKKENNSENEKKEKVEKMSIHDVNKLFAMDPINVEFL